MWFVVCISRSLNRFWISNPIRGVLDEEAAVAVAKRARDFLDRQGVKRRPYYVTVPADGLKAFGLTPGSETAVQR